MFCSSGLRRFPNGRPYWIPIRRSAAARPRSARSGLDLRRCATDEVGDLRVGDEDGVDAGALESSHVVCAGVLEICDRELAGGDVGQKVEDPLEVVLVVLGVAGRQQEDL